MANETNENGVVRQATVVEHADVVNNADHVGRSEKPTADVVDHGVADAAGGSGGFHEYTQREGQVMAGEHPAQADPHRDTGAPVEGSARPEAAAPAGEGYAGSGIRQSAGADGQIAPREPVPGAPGDAAVAGIQGNATRAETGDVATADDLGLHVLDGEDATEEQRLVNANRAAANPTHSPAESVMDVRQETREFAPAEQTTLSAEPAPFTDGAAPGAISGTHLQMPRADETVVTTERDPRGTLTPALTGGNVFGTRPGTNHTAAQLAAPAPVRVLGVAQGVRPPGLARPMLPQANTVETTRAMESDDTVRVTADGSVIEGSPLAAAASLIPVVQPGIHGTQGGISTNHATTPKGSLSTLGNELVLGAIAHRSVGFSTPEEHAQACAEIGRFQRENAGEYEHERDVALARQAQAAEINRRASLEGYGELRQEVRASPGVHLSTSLHSPGTATAPVGVHGIPEVGDVNDDANWVRDAHGGRVFVGAQGQGAMPVTEVGTRDWVHAPNLPADPSPPRTDSVVHAPQPTTNDGL